VCMRMTRFVIPAAVLHTLQSDDANTYRESSGVACTLQQPISSQCSGPWVLRRHLR
jgi:hypothetical protein